MKKLKDLGEFGWLKQLLPKLYWPGSLKSQLWIGPGDDAGALRISPGKVLVATTDAMVEGLHFERRWISWQDLGYKILAVNLSDLAAMGDVKPLSVLITASLPGDTPVDSVDKFYQGMNKCAQRWKVGFLGGDTVGSKNGCVFSVTALGEAYPQNLVQRTGARPGDYLAATGPLGLAAAGLEILQSGKSPRGHWGRPLLQAFNRPLPRFEDGKILGRYHLASSLLDCSDGLEASAKLIADASHVGIEIDLDRLPISPTLARWAAQRSREPWTYPLKGGEDYELIFTVRPYKWKVVEARLPAAKRIGTVVSSSRGVTAIHHGERIPLKRYGFSHF